MRQVLDYAVDGEMIPENIFRKENVDSRRVFDPIKKKPSETQVFTDKEVADIYDYAWKHFEAGRCTVHKLAPLAIMFQFQTRVRIGELCALLSYYSVRHLYTRCCKELGILDKEQPQSKKNLYQ